MDTLMNKDDDYQPKIVDVADVPKRGRPSIWLERFAELSPGKAIKLQYNNRQRADQVQDSLRSSAHFHKIKIHARVIHEKPPVHETEGWMLYFWKA